MKRPLIVTAALALLSLSACGAPSNPTPSPSASSTPTPTTSSSPAASNTKNWTEAQITAYADCLDAQFPKDQMATTARVNLAGMQTQKSRMSEADYQVQLNGIGKLLVESEANRGKLLPGKPSGCEAKIGR